TPNSLAWPVAGAPSLRRPAAVVGLALLLIAWLVALQRQLWLPSGGPGSAARQPVVRVATRPAEVVPASDQREASRPLPATGVRMPSLRRSRTTVVLSRAAERPRSVRKSHPVTRPAVARAADVSSRAPVAQSRRQSQRG